MMSFNYMVKNSDLKIMLEERPKTVTHEAFEIFNFGEKFYRQIEGKNPYRLVHSFVPEGKSVKVSLTDQKVTSLVNKMIDSTSARAEVFSELLVEINQF